MAAGSLVGGDAYGMFGDYLVMLFQGEGGATLRAFDLAGRLVRERPIPSSGSSWGNLTGDPRQPSFYFQFLGVADPATVYRFELPTGDERIVAAPALPFAPGAFVATRQRVRGKDGVEIPVLVAHRAGLALDRPRPLVLYAYGAFGWNSFLWYQPWLAEWFLEQGGVFAVAGVRGGGEQGESWHEAGRRRNRQNAVDDALAVADWLIDRGHTDARRLVFSSSSIAGSLGGSVVAQRPELFGAALLDYPVLDLLRYLEFGQARSWLEELGDPGDPGDFEVLRRLSPYEAAGQASCPPPILVRPGAVDPIVTPVHAFKYVARMQATTGTAKPSAGRATCGPVLLDVLEGAGHDYGGTPAEIAKSHAVALAFLKRVLPR
jgi:prolyl oligopeptidase